MADDSNASQTTAIASSHSNKNEISKLSTSKSLTVTGKHPTINKSLGIKSTTKSIKIKNKPSTTDLECSYDSLLQSYSDEANLCSTPEIRDIYIPSTSNDLNKKTRDSIKKTNQDQPSGN